MSHSTRDDLRGTARLIIDAVAGVTNIIESMHGTIIRRSPIVGAPDDRPTGGISGMVYRSVRGISGAVGLGLDAALKRLPPLLAESTESSRRDALVAVINGVLGDYLVERDSPLAIPMQFRRKGHVLPLERAALSQSLPDANGKLLVLIHGLCMNDRQWHRQGHDHGEALAAELGYTPVYLFYNTGRHIADNGRDFAEQLQRLVDVWPVPLTTLDILAHSMGGLVTRSACLQSGSGEGSWQSRLRSLVCLGTPHHGASLERAGNWVNTVAAISPYSAPFTRIGALRSAGIKDLRHGTIAPDEHHDRPTEATTPLPKQLRCYLLAGSRDKSAGSGKRPALGDGLVSVNSALGCHRNPERSLKVPTSRQHICYGVNHMALLSHASVYSQIHDWLAT